MFISHSGKGEALGAAVIGGPCEQKRQLSSLRTKAAL